MDVVGRKKGLIVSQVLSLIGWIVVCASFDVATVCVGRFVCGMAAAATALICKLRKFEAIEEAKNFIFQRDIALLTKLDLELYM
jgi:hypothetical protein